jgi:hypothetical protein
VTGFIVRFVVRGVDRVGVRRKFYLRSPKATLYMPHNWLVSRVPTIKLSHLRCSAPSTVQTAGSDSADRLTIWSHAVCHSLVFALASKADSRFKACTTLKGNSRNARDILFSRSASGKSPRAAATSSAYARQRRI